MTAPRPVNTDSRDSRVDLMAAYVGEAPEDGCGECIKMCEAAGLLVLDPADDELPDRITRAIDEALRASPVGLVWDHDQTLTVYGVIVRDTIKAALAGDPS